MRQIHRPFSFVDPVQSDGVPPDQQISRMAARLKMAKLVLNHIYNGVLITDPDGYVLFFNEPYGRFLGVDPAEQIGRHASEVVENTRMCIVAQTGRPEINFTHRIKGQDMVVQRIPIIENGEVLAVFGQVMFKDVRDVRRLALKLSLLESKVRLYEEELTTLRSTRYTIDSIQGVSRAVQKLKAQAVKAARNKLPALITGESGTGKELFAQAIHHAGKRRPHPFVRINCSAIPKDLFESELFGYEKGAFTGALTQGKPGKFELADRGTVFLDEIGDLPLELQPKLLRVLEEKEIERVGGNRVIKTDFRLIAATNQDLENMLFKKEFRKDLFYRMNVITLHIPPLRQRREDIPVLARHFLSRIAEESTGRELILLPEAEQILLNYDWPGNVRELQNILEQACANADEDVIEKSHLPFFLTGLAAARVDMAHPSKLKDLLKQTEKEAILSALAATDGNKVEAARLLGIHRTLLYKKIKRCGLANCEES
jgi:transcriptional regulator with PAS, ATPase and Fis domain